MTEPDRVTLVVYRVGTGEMPPAAAAWIDALRGVADGKFLVEEADHDATTALLRGRPFLLVGEPDRIRHYWAGSPPTNGASWRTTPIIGSCRRGDGAATGARAPPASSPRPPQGWDRPIWLDWDQRSTTSSAPSWRPWPSTGGSSA